MYACGMEVVLANGEVLRTGMGSLPNSNTWQVFKWGYGPYLDGIFTQSNYGIVTKFGFWLQPAPPVYKPFLIQFDDEKDIVEIVETIRPLRINGVIPNAVVISHALYDAPVKVKRSDYVTGPGAISDEAVRRIMKDHGLGAWNVYAALYGTQEQVDLSWKMVTQAFGKSGKARFVTQEDAKDDPIFGYRAALMRGGMDLREFNLYNWRGGGGSLWFAPVSQARGSETLKQMELTKRILAKHGLDYTGEFIVGMRDMHHIVDMLFDKTDPAMTKAAYQCFDELVSDVLGAGLRRLSREYRVHGQGGRHVRPGAAEGAPDAQGGAGSERDPRAGEVRYPTVVTMPDRMPAIFLGHGNPLNAIQREPLHTRLARHRSRAAQATRRSRGLGTLVRAGDGDHRRRGAEDDPRLRRLSARALRGAVSGTRRTGPGPSCPGVVEAPRSAARRFLGARSRDLVRASPRLSGRRRSGRSAEHRRETPGFLSFRGRAGSSRRCVTNAC